MVLILIICSDSAPAICIALYSFVSAGTIATSLIAAMVLLSSANLEAISILALGGANCPTSNPSMNLNVSKKLITISNYNLNTNIFHFSQVTTTYMYHFSLFKVTLENIFFPGNGWTPSSLCAYKLVFS